MANAAALTFPKVTPRTARKMILRNFMAGLVPYLRSSPGLGKSSVYKAIAKELDLKFTDNRISTLMAEDFTGLPVRSADGKSAEMVPFSAMFPVEGDPLPLKEDGTPYKGWLMLLDEFNSGTKDIFAAAYKLVLDRQVGLRNLHKNVFIGLAGNLDSDGAITNNIGSALKSRVVHIHMRADTNEWLQDVAFPQNYHRFVLGYLGWKEANLHVFDPKSAEETFRCPRTWEFVSNYCKAHYADTSANTLEDFDIQTFQGMMGQSGSQDFCSYVACYGQIPTFSQILAAPEHTPMPIRMELQYAMTSVLGEAITSENARQVFPFVDRLNDTFKLTLIRTLAARDYAGILCKYPEYDKLADMLTDRRMSTQTAI